jgi:hypothetical protein
MHSLVRLFLAGFYLIASASAAPSSYHIAGDDPGPWPKILSSIGLMNAAGGPANLFVIRTLAPGSAPQWIQRIEQGAVVVIEGESDLAKALGIQPGAKRVVVRSIVDQRAPKLAIIWENALEIPVFELPKQATIFASERWNGAPVMAAVHRGSGSALWIVASPGKEGYERFPYLLQALSDLGVRAPVGVLRWRLSFARGFGLLRRALAKSRNQRLARGWLALLGIRRRKR